MHSMSLLTLLYLFLVDGVEGVDEMLAMLVVRFPGVFLGRNLLHRAFLHCHLHSTILLSHSLLGHPINRNSILKVRNIYLNNTRTFRLLRRTVILDAFISILGQYVGWSFDWSIGPSAVVEFIERILGAEKHLDKRA